jgi:hypothetical protein
VIAFLQQAPGNEKDLKRGRRTMTAAGDGRSVAVIGRDAAVRMTDCGRFFDRARVRESDDQ